ncbi:retrovirus-related pol polyprotein from transposon TNT 1-94 [Tanacetum coccineum]
MIGLCKHSVKSKKQDDSDYVCVNSNDCMSSDNLCVSKAVERLPRLMRASMKTKVLDSESPKPVVKLVYSRKPRKNKNAESVSKTKVVQIRPLDTWTPGCSKHMTGDRSQLTNFISKFLGTVKFGNDQVAKIMGFGDYQIGNVTISRVYYVEGLGHNLFSVGQFCDSNLEVAFRQHTCFIRNLEGVDLLTGSRGDNLYTLSLGNMMASSPICLLSKASNNQSLVMASSSLSFELWFYQSSGKTWTCTRSDWDLLFQPMFDESLNVDFHAPEVIAHIPDAVAPEHAVSTGSPSSTTVDQDAPSPSTSHTTQGTQTPILSHDVEEDNHDIEVAHMGNDPYYIRTMMPLTSVEPKNYKEELTQACWIEAMQEELHNLNSGALRKLLYGLKQAPRAWYDMLSSFLISNDFSKGLVDPTLFIRREGNELILVLLYVDDIIFAALLLNCDLFA